MFPPPQADKDAEFKAEAWTLSSAAVGTQGRGLSARKPGYSGLGGVMNLFGRLLMLALPSAGWG